MQVITTPLSAEIYMAKLIALLHWIFALRCSYKNHCPRILQG